MKALNQVMDLGEREQADKLNKFESVDKQLIIIRRFINDFAIKINSNLEQMTQ